MKCYSCLLIFILFLTLIELTFIECKISDKRLCVDASCSEPVSEAKTLLLYNSDDNQILSFKPNQQVTIFSKSAGDRNDLWGAEINGKRGYVPKGLVRESKVYKTPTIIVPTERAVAENTVNETLPIIETSEDEVKVLLNDLKGSFGLSGVSADSVPPDIQPQQAKFQVLDGTTIYDEVSDHAETVPEEISDTSSETPPLELDLGAKKDDIVKVEETVNNENKKVADETATESNSSQVEVPPIENQVKSGESISVNTQETNSGESETVKVEGKVKKQSAEKGLLASFGETLFGGLVDDEEDDDEDEDESEENVVNAKGDELKPAVIEEKDPSPVLEMSPNLGMGKLKSERVSLNIEESVEQKIVVEEVFDQAKKPEELDEHAMKPKEVDEQAMKPKEINVQVMIPEEQEQKMVEQVNTTSNPIDTPEHSDSISTLPEQPKITEETIKSEELNEQLTKPVELDIHPMRSEEQVGQKIIEQVKFETPERIDSTSTITELPKVAEETIKPEEQKMVEGQKIDFATPEPLDAILTNAEQPKIAEEILKLEKPGVEKIEPEKQVEQLNPTLLEPIEITKLVDPISTIAEQPKIIDEIKLAEDNVESSKNEESELKAVLPVTEESPSNASQSKEEYPSKPNISEIFETDSILSVNITDNTEDILPVSTIDTPLIDQQNNFSAVVDSNLESSDPTKSGDLFKPTVESFQSSEIDFTVSSEKQDILVEKNAEAPVMTEGVPSLIEKLEPSAIINKEPPPMIVDSTQPLNDEIKDQPVLNVDGSILSPVTTDSVVDQQLTDVDVSHQKSEVDENLDSIDRTEHFTQAEKVSTDESESVVEETIKDVIEDVADTSETSLGFFLWFSSLFSGTDVPASVEEVPDVTSVEDASNILISQPEEMSSHPEEQNDQSMWTHRTNMGESQEDSCTRLGLGEDSCAKIDPVEKPEVWTSSKSSNADFVMMSAVSIMDKVPVEMTLLLVVTSLAVLLFTLGYYYIEAHRRDGSLVARINNLERDLLVKKKETAILEDAFSNAQFEVKGRDSDLSEVKETNEELSLELEELRAVRLDLEDQIASLERELETVTESGLEMHRLLSDSLSSQDGSQVLLQTVESLREKLDKQNVQIVQLNQSLGEKNEEIEMLQNQVSASDDEVRALNERLVSLKREKEEEELDIKEKNRALMVQLEEIVETKALEESRMSTELSKLRITLEEVQRKLVEREAEVEAMKDSMRQLRATDEEESLQELYDVAAVSAKLTTAVAERDEFKEKFVEEEGARKLLEDHVRVISREVAELKENFETAEKEKIEALTKLKVLSNYFKEKETELQKELGTQESMWLQKQGDDHTIYEQMRSLREENDKYKLQNESLKKEICDQESSFKIQLANVEQKAHENWVASRQAERRLKEVQQEATQLRNRLTLSETNAVNHDDPKQKMNETNGDPSSPPPSLMFSPTASPFMMYHNMGPIPPGDFIPPPPLMSSFSPDCRPPPLGRISSPPLDPRISPPPPLPMQFSPYDYSYGHHSPSPPPPLSHRTVHKPQPKEAGRDVKDTVTSNYSLETTNKPSRRSKR